MNLTLDIDEETAARVSKIAAARDMTVEAMVVGVPDGDSEQRGWSSSGAYRQDAGGH